MLPSCRDESEKGADGAAGTRGAWEGKCSRDAGSECRAGRASHESNAGIVSCASCSSSTSSVSAGRGLLGVKVMRPHCSKLD